MNKGLATSIAFVVGAGIGAATSWLIAKNSYELYFEEKFNSEMEALDDYYKKLVAKHTVKNEEKPETIESDADISKNGKQDIVEYASKLKDLGYNKTNYTSISEETEEEEKTDEEDNKIELIESTMESVLRPGSEPYVISPTEFGEFDDYERISLVHYSDGVLTDINDIVIDNSSEIVGPNYMEYFGEYEDDAVHIRNDAKKCDYEILVSNESWADILKKKPYKEE
jgi:gas vesicle protein